MAERLSFDTSFLIDFQRERRTAGDGPAHELLRNHRSARLAISAVALGEFAEGFDDADHPLVRVIRDTHEVLPIDDEVALIYARVTRELREQGQLIGGNDLWIAATSLHNQIALVTADRTHFGRIPELRLQTYRGA